MNFEIDDWKNVKAMEVVNLERFRMNAVRYIDAHAANHVLKNMNVSVRKQVGHEIEVAVYVLLAGLMRQQEHIHQFQYPDGWWQMFKREHMPRWFVKRYPVRMKIVKNVVKIDHMAIFPEYDMWHRDRVVMFVDKVV